MESEDGSKLEYEPTVLKPPLFNLQSDVKEVNEYLQENGYIAFENVIDEEEISVAKSKFWDFLEGLGTGINRNQKETWRNENWPNSFAYGLISEYGMGQSKVSWYLRSNPKVRKIFSSIWGTESLITSFDGGSVFRPPIIHDLGDGEIEEWETKGGWYHVDQDYFANPGLTCYQGLVTLMDVDDSTGGLLIVPKSHQKFESFFSKKPKPRTELQFMSVNYNDLVHLGHPVLVSVPAGSMVIWDSRTVHCNSPFLSKEPKSRDDIIRMVVYICMLPKEGVDEQVLEKRRNAVKEAITSSHWPSKWQPKKSSRSTRTKRGLKDITLSTGILSQQEVDPIVRDLLG
eukprot:TRINITY_DN3459_c0_g1_i1.p1 TRINITY_DN3459_c0_g1~~TRINITY_DN3459_c0_g1_i1.p1  ORF type:complete len:343 (-),score=77.07 TRINITY_DN3459_c0_g1_i1:85-1113(-)